MINTINKEHHPEVFEHFINQLEIHNWDDYEVLDKDYRWITCNLILHIGPHYKNIPIDFHGYWKAYNEVNIACEDRDILDIENIIEFKRVIKQSREVLVKEIFYTEV